VNTLKLYIWLTKLPLKQSIPLIIGVGLIIAVFVPALPMQIKEWLVVLVEENWL